MLNSFYFAQKIHLGFVLIIILIFFNYFFDLFVYFIIKTFFDLIEI